MSNLITKQYRVKDGVVKAQYSPDISGYHNNISSCLFILYFITTILVLVIGIPITVNNVKESGDYWWWVYISISLSVYAIVLLIHWMIRESRKKEIMKELEKLMERVNNTDNSKNINWKIDYESKYVSEGLVKKDYHVILELSSSTTDPTTLTEPVPATVQQQIIIVTSDPNTVNTIPTSLTMSSDTMSNGSTTQILSVNPSQLSQILALTTAKR
nr:12495_t:CDS:2 [Entrophospora candida]